MTTNPARREFLRRVAQGAGVATTGGLFWAYLLDLQKSVSAHGLRPPGALPESDFAGTCIKCGQCVGACPYDTLELAASGTDMPVGTPYFTPRETPCFMCEDIPCVTACPTGALDSGLDDIRDARMGVANVDRESCLSWQGLRCEICYRECPVRGDAITIENHPRRKSRHALFVPVIHARDCTGCGVCEKSCPTEIAAIRVVPPDLVKGRVGEHYLIDGESGDGSAAAPGRVDEEEIPGLEYLNEGPE